MKCNTMKWYASDSKYSLNSIYMILLENTSRVHDLWRTHEDHIPTQTISTCLCGWSQCTMIPCKELSQNTHYSLNRIYMILLENTSRDHDPWATREVHILTRTISTCLCGWSQRTIIISKNFCTDGLHVPKLQSWHLTISSTDDLHMTNLYSVSCQCMYTILVQ